ncbi:MAG: hypothetical protein FWC80_03740 [Firmicutes bacterium]|nr:hypothetical protein [Bacillota bacterium]
MNHNIKKDCSNCSHFEHYFVWKNRRYRATNLGCCKIKSRTIRITTCNKWQNKYIRLFP